MSRADPSLVASRSGTNFIAATMLPARRVTRTKGRGFSISSAVTRAISSGSALRSPLAPAVPATSSVLVNVGRTVDSRTPDLRYSSRAASVNPMTANLVPQ
ncbi:Uncharacterised protein [Mycobacteroides abscessus subsp. abscessus]|nr:Uncharacterised protein [Mycobacteroides abscessus subsp. abscessus]